MNKTKVSVFCSMILMVNVMVWAGQVPNTGQTKGYDASGNVITCPSPGQSLYEQDANHNTTPKSFSKLDGNGNVLQDSASSWAMVKDNVTGLIWENKTDDGSIHDKDNTFTWSGTSNFINSLNSDRFGGFSDWRMPTLKELESISDYNISYPGSYPGPTINTTFFRNTVSGFYWSSTTSAFNTDYAWGLNFLDGFGTDGNKTDSYYVRAVRGGQ